MTLKEVRFSFSGSNILLRTDSEITLSHLDTSLADLPVPIDVCKASKFVNCALYEQNTSPPTGWEWTPMRTILMNLREADWNYVARAMAIANWHVSTKYCGRCGSINTDKNDEIARLCPKCGNLTFPRISPAILAVVSKGSKLLLARNAANTSGMWSILAGFVEPGETFEGCLSREVKEEVGIDVAVTGYLGSQPWPFPDQLMLGFAAEWQSGELEPDGIEIAEAGWFSFDECPPLPRSGSLSRRLIDGFFAPLR